jgi:hypothetical protein
MPRHKDNLVALAPEGVASFHAPQNIGAFMPDDSQPPESPRGIKRFYNSPFIGRALRFFTWWLIISGIYAGSAV